MYRGHWRDAASFGWDWTRLTIDPTAKPYDVPDEGGTGLSTAATQPVLHSHVSDRETPTWTRLGAAVGLLSIIVATIGFFLHGNPPLGKSGADIVTWAAGVDQSRFAVGIYVELLGYLLFLVFAAWIWSVARPAAPGSTWLGVGALLAAAVFIAISATSDGVWLALLDGARGGTSAATLTLMRSGAEHVFEVSFLFGGLFSLLIGAAMLTGQRLPRWMGISSVVLGVAVLIPPIALIASLLWEIWVVAVSLALLIRPDAATRGDSTVARTI